MPGIIIFLVFMIILVKSSMAFGFLNVMLFIFCISLAITVIIWIIRLAPEILKITFEISFFIYNTTVFIGVFLIYTLSVLGLPFMAATMSFKAINSFLHITNQNHILFIILSLSIPLSFIAYFKTKKYAMQFFKSIANQGQ